jgi:hypothetical protein
MTTSNMTEFRAVCTPIDYRKFNRMVAREEAGKRISHCFASCDIHFNGHQVCKIVLDKYTPKNGQTGWYFAFRYPGKTENIRPVIRVYAGETLASVVLNDHFNYQTFIDMWHAHSSEWYKNARTAKRSAV